MRVAIPFENNEVFQHFGHTSQFIFYDIDVNSDEVEYEIVDTEGQGHGALAGFLSERDTDVVICGGIGPGAISALSGNGILVFPGVEGKCGDALISLLRGDLVADTRGNCDHHKEEEGSCCCHGEHGGERECEGQCDCGHE